MNNNIAQAIDRAAFEKFRKRVGECERRNSLARRITWSAPPPEFAVYNRMLDIKKFSMLHVDVLMGLWWLAQNTRHAILELGPYIGGSTVALALGAAAAGTDKVITVEPGGAYRAHPHIPSADILGDLRRNLSANGVLDQATIIEGRSFEPNTQRLIADQLSGRRIGLFFVDADGSVEADLERFSPTFATGAFIVVDDYVSDMAAEKSSLINPAIDRWVAEGRLEPWGVIGWGTWFGRYVARAAL